MSRTVLVTALPVHKSTTKKNYGLLSSPPAPSILLCRISEQSPRLFPPLTGCVPSALKLIMPPAIATHPASS